MKNKIYLTLLIIVSIIFSVGIIGYTGYLAVNNLFSSPNKVNIVLHFKAEDIKKITVEIQTNDSNPIEWIKNNEFTLTQQDQFDMVHRSVQQVKIIDKIINKEIELNRLQYYFNITIDYLSEGKIIQTKLSTYTYHQQLTYVCVDNVIYKDVYANHLWLYEKLLEAKDLSN